jgi:SWI/SNF-related matrix-associated actin-dependent regulator of chromatin subfamily A member 5
MDGLNWMISLYETGINGILADEMGLGKTIQTISLITFLREFKGINGHHLILMPKSVVGNWMAEFKRWNPAVKICNLIARKESRDEIIKTELAPGNFDVCITTFEGVRLC